MLNIVWIYQTDSKHSVNYAGAGNYYGIQWIKIDGMLLIDKGVGPDTGDNKVTDTLQLLVLMLMV